MAGIAGAALWWCLRGLGVKGGLGISSVLPLFFPVVYLYVLPDWSQLQKSTYQPLAADEDEPIVGGEAALPPTVSRADSEIGKHIKVYLTPREKLELLKPLVLRYMVPLCLVYIEEYVINSGVAPTLLFPIPSWGPWSWLFKTPRDYYPFWSLTCELYAYSLTPDQTFVFISRSSLSLGLPALPRSLLPLPTILQFFVLVLLSLQARSFIFSSPEYTPPAPEPKTGVDPAITAVFLLICLEGLCGGTAYVNTFFHVGREGEHEVDDESEESIKRKMEKEFRIGATGAADSCGK